MRGVVFPGFLRVSAVFAQSPPEVYHAGMEQKQKPEQPAR
jgi:hypothetical protein